MYWCSVTTLTQCITAAVLCLEQLRGTSRDCSHFQWKFLWQLGAGERGDEGASRTCLCRPACFGRPSRDIPKSPSQSVSQPVNRRLRMSAQLPLVLLRCGGTISEAEICLKRTNCRLWAGQGWGTVDTLKIAHALDKFRGPTQVTSVFRLHHFCLV